jgi:hypothetical protein
METHKQPHNESNSEQPASFLCLGLTVGLLVSCHESLTGTPVWWWGQADGLMARKGK